VSEADRRFLLVGLTGGVATGKSTVSAMFRALGCVVIDADQIARQVVEPGAPAWDQIVAAFGRGILEPDGRIDRKALGALVFGDPAARRRLESFTHPEIRARVRARLGELRAEGFEGVVIFDAPVMIESGGYRDVDRLVVVTAGEPAQLARQQERDGLSREDATRRVRSQLPLAEKVRLADYVIDNSGALSATTARVGEVYRELLRELHARRR
jgi:dephospho-CoA kinase